MPVTRAGVGTVVSASEVAADVATQAELDALSDHTSGLLVSIPSAVTAGSGGTYYATDDNGGTVYVSDGATWAALNLAGREVKDGYIQMTSNWTDATGGPQDITGMSITFTPLQAGVVLRAGGSTIVQTLSGSSPNVQICDSANTAIAVCQETVLTGRLNFDFGVKQAKVSLTPGAAVTYKLRGNRGGGSGTITVSGSSTSPAWLQAVYI